MGWSAKREGPARLAPTAGSSDFIPRPMTSVQKWKGFQPGSERMGFAFENNLFGCLEDGELIMILLFLRKANSLGGALRKGQPCMTPTLMNNLNSMELFYQRSM